MLVNNQELNSCIDVFTCVQTSLMLLQIQLRRPDRQLQDVVARFLALLHAPQFRTHLHERKNRPFPTLYESNYHQGVWFQERLGSRDRAYF